jgi:hypothetical protein
MDGAGQHLIRALDLGGRNSNARRMRDAPTLR